MYLDEDEMRNTWGEEGLLMYAGGRMRLYSDAKDYLDEEETLESTYWLFDEPDFPNIWDRAGDFLEDMCEKFGVKPAKIDNNDRIFEARYEIVKHGEELTYSEAILDTSTAPVAFMDFMSGVPYNAVEMKPILWELSTKEDEYPALTDEDAAAPPVPDIFFDETYTEPKISYDYLFLDADGVEGLMKGLSGEQGTDFLWWTRHNMILPEEADEPRKYPTPGEFMALGVRLFPTKPWGDNTTSPFMFSGNWFDTLYYTSAIVEEVLEPTDLRPFPLYKVKWRGKEEDKEDDPEEYNKFYARPSGFEEYKPGDVIQAKPGDRVAILKDVATTRKSQTWKDDQEFLEPIWRIAPITFYEMKRE